MDIPHDIPVRNARNRLIDLLGIGDTYPLVDLNVVADQLKVPFGGKAKIPIQNAQAGVTYELCDPKGQPLGAAFKADGSDATLVIDTPNVSEDVTYRIRATKMTAAGSALPPQAPRFLDETAPVQVGLDTMLVIEITDFKIGSLPALFRAPLLDPTNANPQPSDPRIVPFGAIVSVRVNNTQEGVQYSLMLDGVDLSGVTVMGNLAGIVLPTGPMQEDTVIQVRATKNFLAAENRSSETKPLNAKLYLKVLANPALAVSVDASPVIDFGRDATVTVARTQQSAKYRAYVRAIRDRDFFRGARTDASLVTVPVPGKAGVQVLKPPPTDGWRTPDGYAPTGDNPVPGTGGDLKFTVKALADDAMVIVQAIKEHQADPGKPASTIPSAIRLEPAAVVLVRPDPARMLTVRVPVVGAQTGETLRVSNGQPGVFYYFRPGPAGVELPLPAYFHKRDDEDGTQNKGINQLALQIDLAIAAAPNQSGAGPGDRARVPPLPPLLGISPLATDSGLSIRAIKAQTAVEAPMALAAQIAAVPKIRADQDVVDFRGTATVLIPGSAPAEQYQLVLQGAAVKPALIGNGADLSVTTDPLTADAVFDVIVTRPRDGGMPVERVVQVPIAVRPDASSALTPRQGTVDKGAGTDILVQSSQQGVSYQLMSGQNAVGPAVVGTGGAVALPTGPVSADTTLTVVASRVDNPRLTVVLVARATVKIKP